MAIEDTINSYEYKLKQAGVAEPLSTYIADPADVDRLSAGFAAMVGGRLVTGATALPVAQSAGVTVATSRTATAADLETVVSVTAASTLTIPSDATLGITDANYRCKITTYQTTAGAVSIVGSGSTLRNAQPTAAQYKLTTLVRVAANEWAFVV